MEQSEYKKQLLETRVLEKEANRLVLAYQFLPNDSSFRGGNKEIRVISVYAPKRLVESTILDGQEKYGKNFIPVAKEVLTENTDSAKLNEGEIK